MLVTATVVLSLIVLPLVLATLVAGDSSWYPRRGRVDLATHRLRRAVRRSGLWLPRALWWGSRTYSSGRTESPAQAGASRLSVGPTRGRPSPGSPTSTSTSPTGRSCSRWSPRRRAVGGWLVATHRYRRAEIACQGPSSVRQGRERPQALGDRDHRLVREPVEQRVDDPVGRAVGRRRPCGAAGRCSRARSGGRRSSDEVPAGSGRVRRPSRSSGRPSTRSSRRCGRSAERPCAPCPGRSCRCGGALRVDPGGALDLRRDHEREVDLAAVCAAGRHRRARAGHDSRLRSASGRPAPRRAGRGRSGRRP